MHTYNVKSAGVPLAEAKKILILLHGRGAQATDILALTNHLNVNGFALLAPQAAHNTWYPYSFIAPVANNEPELTSALTLLEKLLAQVLASGISAENIYWAGFSQGACLTVEFAARHAQRFGGIAVFTGGLIGEALDGRRYSGDFNGTPIFIGTGNPDPHVPLERVTESAALLEKMGAQVTLVVYPGRPHTVSNAEISEVNKLLFSS